MLVEQATFASTNTSRFSGYQLVGRSPGVDDQLAQALCRWSPGHGGLLNHRVESESLSYFQATEHWHVISRTVYGGPEHGMRSGRQLVTKFVALSRQQFQTFEYNAIAVAQTLMSMDDLHLEFSLSRSDRIELPDQPVIHVDLFTDTMTPCEGRLANLLGNGLPAAIIGEKAPVEFLKGFLPKLPEDLRALASFATGLELTEQRPYLVQFFPEVDVALKNRLRQLQISSIPAHNHWSFIR